MACLLSCRVLQMSKYWNVTCRMFGFLLVDSYTGFVFWDVCFPCHSLLANPTAVITKLTPKTSFTKSLKADTMFWILFYSHSVISIYGLWDFKVIDHFNVAWFINGVDRTWVCGGWGNWCMWSLVLTSHVIILSCSLRNAWGKRLGFFSVFLHINFIQDF